MTFFIESLGCAKNQVDSEYLIADLEARGLRWVRSPEEARIIIVNTCGFITSAKDESIQISLSLKDRFPQKKVIMLGCLVQRYGAELEREMGEIDGFVGLNDPEALWRLISSGGGDGTGDSEIYDKKDVVTFAIIIALTKFSMYSLIMERALSPKVASR